MTIDEFMNHDCVCSSFGVVFVDGCELHCSFLCLHVSVVRRVISECIFVRFERSGTRLCPMRSHQKHDQFGTDCKLLIGSSSGYDNLGRGMKTSRWNRCKN